MVNSLIKRTFRALGFIVLLAACYTQAQAAVDTECITELLTTADDDTTMGELRSRCASQATAATGPDADLADAKTADATLLQQRFASEFDSMNRPYSITPHKLNYVLPYTYNSKLNTDVIDAIEEGERLDNEEVKFQVSMKFPLWRGFLSPSNDIYFAFTSTAWWQAYNSDISEAFRETNYEPEFFLRHYDGQTDLLGGKLAGFDVGFNHQSNGRAGGLSRSWNRLLAQTAIDYDELVIAARVWYRLPEKDDEDDNPNEYRYLGYGDIRASWAPNRNVFTAMFRPGTEGSAIELSWSYPLSNYLRLYAQYFNGYGESLLDYDARTERIGIGLSLNDMIMR